MNYETLLALHQGGARLQIVRHHDSIALEADGEEVVAFVAPVRALIIQEDERSFCAVFVDQVPKDFMFSCYSQQEGHTTCGVSWASGQPVASRDDEQVGLFLAHLFQRWPTLVPYWEWPPNVELSAKALPPEPWDTITNASWQLKERLDDLVHQYFDELAAEVNREGIQAQVRFLLAHGGEDDLREALEHEAKFKQPETVYQEVCP